MTEHPLSAVSTLSMLAEPIPRSVALATWVNSWLDGACSADAVVEGMAPFGVQRVAAPTGDPADELGLLIGLATLGVSATPGSGRLRVALPSVGDPSGLPGPPTFNQQAISVGQAVLIDTIHVALLPNVTETQTTWSVYETRRDTQVAVPVRAEQSAQVVREALQKATAQLSTIDFAGGRDTITATLAELSTRLRAVLLPPSLAGTQRHTIHTAAQVLGICELALRQGPDVPTAALHRQRAGVLTELAVTARHCLAAAASPR